MVRWCILNLYGFLFGWPVLANFHRALFSIALHGLGYDNVRFSGEEWLVKTILAPMKLRVCVDVGANVGEYTRLLLRHTGAKIFAIEPSKEALARVPKHIRVERLEMAVSNYDGEGSLFSKSGLDERGSMRKEIRDGESHQVTVRRLDSLFEEIDFLKIDVEGLEFEVLQSLGDIRPKIIQFEYNHHHLLRGQSLYSIASLLSGYRLYRLLPHGLMEVDPTKAVHNVYMFSNVVAIMQ